ncbi:MAG: type II secretion system protein [Pseudomonadota bacterium]
MRSMHGFTLMEMIAVMAIIGILAAVLAPSIVDAIDRADAAAERTNTTQLADDLQEHIRRTATIPGRAATSWGPAIATVSSRPVSDVTANRRGFTRTVYFDPNFLTAAGGFNGYAQTSGLALAPVSPRFMIISNLRGNVATQANNAATFDAIWNQTSGAAVLESEDILIERRHLGFLFHPVLLSNSEGQQVGFALNSSGQFAIPAASSGTDGLLSTWVLDGSQLSVFASPYPVGGLGTVVLVNDGLNIRNAANGAVFQWVLP